MTKKDYITIANALKPFYKYDDYEVEILEIIQALSKALKADNPAFNPVKFLDYLRQ